MFLIGREICGNGDQFSCREIGVPALGGGSRRLTTRREVRGIDRVHAQQRFRSAARIPARLPRLRERHQVSLGFNQDALTDRQVGQRFERPFVLRRHFENTFVERLGARVEAVRCQVLRDALEQRYGARCLVRA